MHKSVAKIYLQSEYTFTVGAGTTCPCVDDLCNGNSWDSIFNAQRNEAVNTKYKSTRRENAAKVMSTINHMYISTQRENAMKMMSTNDYMNTEGIKNGEHVNIPDRPTPDPSTNLLMTGPDPSNAESSVDDKNGPSVICLVLCGIFACPHFFRSFELI